MSQGRRDQSAVAGFREGLSLMADGVAFLRRERTLWPLAFVPVLFASVLVGLAFLLFWARLEMVREAWVSVLPVLEVTNWWSWIWIGPGRLVLWFVGWLGVLVALAIALLTALLSANVLSAPFLDRLSARVEAIEEGVSADREEGLAAMLRETGRSFAAEFQRLAFLAAVWVSLGLAGFIFPGAHLITGPLLIAATVLLLPLDYAGFALDRMGIPFRTRRRWLRENWPTMTAFGGVAFLSCLVPGLNLLVLPVFVTAGTLLVIRIRPRETDSDPGTSLV